MAGNQKNPVLTKRAKAVVAKVEEAIEPLGASVEHVSMTGGNHLVLTVVAGEQKRKVFAPFTASDHRAVKNLMASTKKIVMGMMP